MREKKEGNYILRKAFDKFIYWFGLIYFFIFIIEFVLFLIGFVIGFYASFIGAV
jgi:hypothetical protein